MPLDFSHTKTDSVVVATLKGTIIAGNDTEVLKQKLEELLEAGELQIVLDVGQVTFVDSTGIGALIRGAQAAVRKGGAMKIVHLTKRIHDVLQITRLSAVFSIYDDLQKAIQSF